MTATVIPRHVCGPRCHIRRPVDYESAREREALQRRVIEAEALVVRVHRVCDEGPGLASALVNTAYLLDHRIHPAQVSSGVADTDVNRPKRLHTLAVP